MCVCAHFKSYQPMVTVKSGKMHCEFACIILNLQNHVIERLWVEVNRRINYPIKTVLIDMVQNGELCMEDSLHQYSCSWLSLHVSIVGASLFVASWNAHPIPGTMKALKC